jgi:hypothetical protein
MSNIQMTQPLSDRGYVLPHLRKATNVVAIADIHGWPQPPAYAAAMAMLTAARAVQHTITEPVAAVDKPKDIARWVEASTQNRMRAEVRAQVVDELILTWERNAAAAGLAAVGDVCTRLVEHFGALVTKFDTLTDAPRRITGHESEDQLAAHAEALRVASQMSDALPQRATLGDAANEAGDIGPDIIWLAVHPHANTSRDALNDALTTYKHRMPQGLEEWDALRPLGLRLAAIGEVAARRQRHSDFMYTVGLASADGGIADHRYGELGDIDPGSANSAAASASL